jgi:hypothetical protein
MTESDLERVMIANYSQVFKQILSSLFKSDEKLRTDYMSVPIDRQRDIDQELSAKSNRMAKSLVSKLKQRGYLQNEPPDSELEARPLKSLEPAHDRDCGHKRDEGGRCNWGLLLQKVSQEYLE